MHERDHRLSLLGRVSSLLAQADIPYALVGAAALAIYAVSRSTEDLDLLVTDRRCLDPGLWAPLAASGASADVRKGDFSDPLAGVVRCSALGQRPVDLVVGKSAWQTATLARAENRAIADVELPVLRAADLILVKLYAGGPQDAWDVTQLLAAGNEENLFAEVEEHLGELPTPAKDLWLRIRTDRKA